MCGIVRVELCRGMTGWRDVTVCCWEVDKVLACVCDVSVVGAWVTNGNNNALLLLIVTGRRLRKWTCERTHDIKKVPSKCLLKINFLVKNDKIKVFGKQQNLVSNKCLNNKYATNYSQKRYILNDTHFVLILMRIHNNNDSSKKYWNSCFTITNNECKHLIQKISDNIFCPITRLPTADCRRFRKHPKTLNRKSLCGPFA